MAVVELSVAFGKQAAQVQLPAAATLRELASTLAQQFDVAPHTIKLLMPGGKGMLRLEEKPEATLQEAGVPPGAKLKMMASRATAVAAVQQAQEESRVPGFDHELRRELHRAGAGAVQGGGSQLPAGPYTFQRYEAWQRARLAPPPAEALKLLHRLAADPGIVGVMNKHKWTVGLLSEMPPEGKVGVSPVCILGVNINRGQEISLRLRTDDLKGFRRYDRIRETLLHELAHMVHGDHDANFKQLNSQLRRECDSFDWRGAAARSLAGPAFEGSLQYDLPPERQTVMQQTAASSGRTLRQLAAERGESAAAAAAPPLDSRQAAAAAALRRAGEAGPGPTTSQAQQEQQAQQQPQQQAQQQPAQAQQQAEQQQFSKGQRVLYRQRDGSWAEAKVVAVDYSVLPYSYGIEIDGQYRETEAPRLAPLPQQQQQQDGGGEVQGLGHRDSETEAKEEAVRQLEQ